MDTITLDELRSKMERGDDFTLVETLAPDLYEAGHLPGAVNLPPDRLRERASEVLPDRDADIVTYCGGGG